MSNHRAHRRTAALGLLLAFTLIAAACGNSSGSSSSTTAGSSGNSGATVTTAAGQTGASGAPAGFNEPDSSGTPKEGGSINFGVESQTSSLDPAGTLAQPSDIDMALAIYDPLIAYSPDGKLVPTSLATKWTSTPDFKTWTITVRTGVKFQDGTPFSAASVVSQFTHFKAIGANCTCQPDVALMSSVTSSNPTTVVFKLTQANSLFPYLLAGTEGFIASPTAVAKFGSGYARHPVGTGPFSLVSLDTGVLKKNPLYWKKDSSGRQLPYLDQITIKPITDAQVRLSSLESGDIDIAQTADTSNIVAVVKDHIKSLKVQKITGTSSTIVLFNLKKAPFNNLKMRQAFAYALNRQQINNVQYQGSREESYGAFPPGSQYYVKTDTPTYNPAKAKALVKELKAEGVNTSFGAVCIPTPESRTVLGLVKQQMQAVGITMNNTFTDQGTLVSEVLTKSGNYQASCFRDPQIADADGLHDSLITGGATNVTFYSNAKVDAALKDIRATNDEARQVADMHTVEIQTAKDLPILPILFDLFGNIYNTKLSGLPAPEPWSLGAIKFTTLYLKS